MAITMIDELDHFIDEMWAQLVETKNLCGVRGWLSGWTGLDDRIAPNGYVAVEATLETNVATTTYREVWDMVKRLEKAPYPKPMSHAAYVCRMVKAYFRKYTIPFCLGRVGRDTWKQAEK